MWWPRGLGRACSHVVNKGWCDVNPVNNSRSPARRLFLLLSTAFLVLLGIAVPADTAGAAPQASSLDVFVGYADTLRANPTQFPTPWDGAPGVVFAGCHANCSFDAGRRALREQLAGRTDA